jgi:hypothetical protein
VAETDLADPSDQADALQNQLLGWYLQTSITATEFPEVADAVLRNLLLTCSADPAVTDRVKNAYARHSAPVQLEVDQEEETAVIGSLRQLITPIRSSLFVAEIAGEAERKLLATGFYLLMTPRHTGEVLRRLGIETERLSAMGRGVRLTKGTLERIQQLAAKWEASNLDAVLALDVD